SADGTRWQASKALANTRKYTFEAAGLDSNGTPFHNTSTFATLAASKVVAAWVSPLAGTTVGVGQPIVVQFSKAVTERAIVEKHLGVETSQPVAGAWHWMTDRVVHFRPENYWPAHTQVTLHTNLKDLAVGDGRFGDTNRTIPFTIGREQITVVDV